MRRIPSYQAWRRSLAVFALAARVGWSLWRASRRARALPPEAADALLARAYRREGARIRRAAIDLAGLVIKVGQFLSTRVDVLPAPFVAELAELQDLVPPVPWPEARSRLVAAYGTWPIPDIVDVDPEPVAAASLAQVHRGRLRAGDGERMGAPVAVKIWRPGIEGLVDADIGTLRTVTRFIARHTSWGRRFDLEALFREFEATTREELDAFHEANRAIEFSSRLRPGDRVGAPRVYRDLTRHGVLVMEFVEGERVDAPGALERAGVTGPEMADRLMRHYLKQILRDGLFHADPHPGNLLLRPDGTLVFVDFGMMGRFTPGDRAGLAELLRALFTSDWDGVAEAIERLGFLRPGADLAEVAETMRELLEPAVEGTRLSERVDIRWLLRQMELAIYQLPIQFPARFAFLGRALGMVMGLALRLNPEEPFERQFRRAVEDVVLGRSGRYATRPAEWETLGGAAARAGAEAGGGAAGSGEPGGGDRAAAGAGSAFEFRLDDAILELGRRGLTAVRIALALPMRLERALSRLEAGRASTTEAAAELARRLAGLRSSVDRAGWLALAGLAWLSGALYRVSTGGPVPFRVEWPVYLSWAAAASALFLAWRAGRRGGEER